MEINEYKKILRKEKISARESLPEEDRISFSAEICSRILETQAYKAAETVMIYKWVRGEVRLDEFEKAALTDGKTLVYPLCVSKTEMIAVRPGDEEDAWKKGSFGIPEPDPDKGTVIPPDEIDLVIAPCSSFDDKCRRLGMGGGYYDRYLPACTDAAIIAVAFENQRADVIPADGYDRPVDAVITETSIYK